MLYIMRHGKTDWNEQYKLQGHTDIPLNAAGREMAENAAKEYADVHFDICFSSPLVRAVETAEILLRGRKVPIHTDERLIEMCFGDYEGIARCYEIPNCPMNVFFQQPEAYKEPVAGGESMDALFARTKSFLEETAMPLVNAGKDVLIVGHGAMNSSIVCQVKQKARKDFWSDGIKNCKLMKLL